MGRNEKGRRVRVKGLNDDMRKISNAALQVHSGFESQYMRVWSKVLVNDIPVPLDVSGRSLSATTCVMTILSNDTDSFVISKLIFSRSLPSTLVGPVRHTPSRRAPPARARMSSKGAWDRGHL